MKKKYLTPNSRTVNIQGPAPLMTSGTMNVNSFKSGATINIGDVDPAGVRSNRNYVDWDNENSTYE